MSTLRITNIEAKADPSSPTVDEKIKLTNSNGDILVHIDGKTSGITTIGINTTAGNIKFDQNSNVVVTGIITATKFVGTVEPTSLEIGSNIKLGNAGVITATSYVGDGSALTGIDATQIQTGNTSVQTVDTGSNGHVKINTEGTERLRIASNGKVGIDNTAPHRQLVVGDGGDISCFGANGGIYFGTSTGGFRNNGAIARAQQAGYHVSSSQVGDLVMAPEADKALIFSSGGSSTMYERLRLTTGGNIGINDSGPNFHLDVNGNVALREGQVLTWHDGSGNKAGDIYMDSSDNFVIRNTSSVTERLRITSGGDVLIADTTNSVYNDTSGGGINLKANGQIVAKKQATSTADPLVWLNDTGQTTNKFIVFAQDGTEKSYIGLSGNDLLFGVNGGDRVRIDSDGHLQIRIEGVASMSGQDTRHTRYIIRQSNGQEAILGSVFAQGKSNWGGDLVFATKTANGNPSSGLTERMRLNGAGYFGVGINNPTNRLHVYSSADTGEIRLGGGNGSGNHRLFFQAHPSTAYIDSYGNNTHNPLTINANPLTFNTSGGGAVTFGTTTNNPGDGNTTAGAAIRTNGKYFFSCSTDGGHMNRNNNGYVLHARHSGNHVGGVYVHTSATSFQTGSDYRLKENVVSLDGAITRVKQLAPKRFNFIADASRTVDGFLAHEAATVVPEAVTGTHNEVDDDNNPVYQGIDQSKLVPLLTAALQEAIAKIETLETQLTDALARITALEA